jgi:A/G-specific adenine glycosylase
MPESSLHQPLLDWYAVHRRDLPWRRKGVTGWEVLVSEVMLQQTPVARVLPVYATWMARWPTPAALAAEPAGEAIRAWGRLGYPRRALRLHAAAVVIDEEYDGVVPASYPSLSSLPGVGEYTACAVLAFAHQQHTVVLDTNIRRVLSRLLGGEQYPPGHLTRSERERAAGVLPDDSRTSARWNVALMELGALVCTAQEARCTRCPLRAGCRWRQAGTPAHAGPPRRGQPYAGTDRQCRGRILALLRQADDPVPVADITTCWDDPVQRERALFSLLDDGLVVRTEQGALGLP